MPFFQKFQKYISLNSEEVKFLSPLFTHILPKSGVLWGKVVNYITAWYSITFNEYQVVT